MKSKQKSPLGKDFEVVGQQVGSLENLLLPLLLAQKYSQENVHSLLCHLYFFQLPMSVSQEEMYRASLNFVSFTPLRQSALSIKGCIYHMGVDVKDKVFLAQL